MRHGPTSKKLARKLSLGLMCGSPLQRAKVIEDMTLDRRQSLGLVP